MVLTPLLSFAARRLGMMASTQETQAGLLPKETQDIGARVIVVGFGRVGQMVARVLEQESIPYVALDTDGKLVTSERDRGIPIYFGDGRRREILERAGAANAEAVAATLADAEGAERIATICTKHWPHLVLFARAKDRAHAARLASRQAIVVEDTVEPSLQLAARVLERLGYPDGRISQTLAAVREIEMSEPREGEEAAKAKHPRKRRRES
jgi:CPA2 family monovalent cation:H+ antiporter-2